MFRFLETLPLDRKHTPRVYVIANSDTGSASTMEEFEAPRAGKTPHHETHYIPRSRVVGQSYVTSIFTTLYSFIYSAILVYNSRPDVLLANGPGTCLPLLISAWFYRTLGIAPCAIVLLESYACVKHESLTGKLCKRFVDRYCVQWTELLQPNAPHIVYTGRIPVSQFSSATSNPVDVIGKRTNQSYRSSPLFSFSELKLTLFHLIASKSYVLITVGSTLFEDLTKAIDTPEFAKLLKQNGFNGLHVQYGKGAAPSLKSIPGFEVVLYDYKKTGWKEEMSNAALVIGHAGAGTILDSLEARKPIIVVANDKLMSMHQTEISDVMNKLGFLYSSTPSRLLKDLPDMLPQLSSLAVFPKTETRAFANELSKILHAPERKEEKEEKVEAPKSPQRKRAPKSPKASGRS